MTETKKIRCSECGNNPTNHLFSLIGNTASILLYPLDTILVGNFFGKKIGQFIVYATKPYLAILKSLHLISWNTDSSKALTKRAQVIWEEAQKRNIPMKQLVILGRPVEFYTAKIKGGKTLFFESIPQTKCGYIESYGWMDDKNILKKKLAQKNIATPRGGSAWNYAQALHIFKQIGGPVIIKPRIGSRGRHTTTFIYTEEDFKKAYQSAKKLCFFVIIEEHLIGSVYRGTCINNTLVGVLEGMPPRITGTGVHTISELLKQKNLSLPDNHIRSVTIDTKMEEFLTRLGYTPLSILPARLTIDVSEKIGLSYGGNSRELFKETHPLLIQELEKAAICVNAGVIGFDFIIDDPRTNPENKKWGIIECNSLPFINLHHDPHEGEPINIAELVWNEVEARYVK